jgi:hypothetical protein
MRSLRDAAQGGRELRLGRVRGPWSARGFAGVTLVGHTQLLKPVSSAHR